LNRLIKEARGGKWEVEKRERRYRKEGNLGDGGLST